MYLKIKDFYALLTTNQIPETIEFKNYLVP
jgi:hypothetical protein